MRIFQNHPVNRRNQTGDEMMCRRGNLVERHFCSIRQSIESLTRLGKDWTLMLQSNLILSLELLHEDWTQKLLNQDHHSGCPLRVQR